MGSKLDSDLRGLADSDGTVAHAVGGPSRSLNILRKEGDYWTIVYGGALCRLRDSKGLQQLAHLLRRPGARIPAVQLSEPRQTPSAAASNLDEPPPSEASYEERVRQLTAELELASTRPASAHALVLQQEIEFLTQRLALLTHTRSKTAVEERARLTVTKNIKAALDKIGQCHPALAAHLGATVRRGYFCSYTPDPRHPITWEE